MPQLRNSIPPIPIQQVDAVLNQANPVSTTSYTVLNTTRNARILSVDSMITWAVTQPTPLETILTIDGITITYVQANPVSAIGYDAYASTTTAANAQTMTANHDLSMYRAFLLEGRSVKIEARVTWAITQPTPLTNRVKYAKW